MPSDSKKFLEIDDRRKAADDDDRDEEEEADGEDGDEQEYESTWIAPTVLKVHAIVEASIVNSVNKYLNKHPRVWKDSALLDEADFEDDDEDSGDDEDDEEEDDEDDDASKEPHEIKRSCFVSADTNTLGRYFTAMDPIVQASVEQFVSRFAHFNIISSFDDYACVEYRKGSFRKPAPERTGIDRGEGAARALVALVLLVDSDGKDLRFHSAHGGDDGVWLEGKAGDVFVWPACALHPYEVVARDDRATQFRYVQVNIA